MASTGPDGDGVDEHDPDDAGDHDVDDHVDKAAPETGPRPGTPKAVAPRAKPDSGPPPDSCKANKKKKDKAVVSAHTQMVHTRVMDLLCREDRSLIADSFDQSGRFLAKGKTGDVRKDRALLRYGKLWHKLDKWLKKRSKSGLVGFSVPTFIWLQPDLTTTEKMLLADVWHLENAKLRCFKENPSFAIELGLSAASVANIISELTKFGFLKPRQLEGDKWYLSLGDALSGHGNEAGKGHRKMKAGFTGK